VVTQEETGRSLPVGYGT